VYTLIDRRDHPGGWLAKFKCEISEIREISPPSSAGLPNKMSAKSAISAKSPPHSRHAEALRSGAMLGNFSGRISMGRTLPCLCLEQVSYMDKFRRAGWVGLSVLRGQAGDKRDSDRGWRVSRLSASVFIWPGMASGRCPVVQFSPSCQKLPNQENALGAPCLRCDFCSPPAPSRCAGMLRTDVAFDVTLAVAITKASRRQALMLFPVIGGRCTTKSAPVQGQTGPSWQDGTDKWVLTNTVVRFLGRVKTEREKISLVTMAALCFFIFAQ
jgi:hypothetical protein